MNKISQNIPNLIKQPSSCCTYCGKSYKKKTNLEKHTIICELLNDCKKRTNTIINYEDDEESPSNQKIYGILLELGNRFNKLEKKMEEIDNWMIKKKKKMNVLEWLNDNKKSEIIFDNLIEKIYIQQEDIQFLIEKTFIETINNLLNKCLHNLMNSPDLIPLSAFIQKKNSIYVYENQEEGWTELTKEKLIKFLNKVHMKLFRSFCDFKRSNCDKIKNDDTFSVICDKTSVKLMEIDFGKDNILSKIKTIIFNTIKSDMKTLIEF